MTIEEGGNHLNVLAVVHARGGSKRIPRKNIMPLCGKPLIGYCLEAARGSAFIDKLIVSSDSKEIQDVARSFGAEIPFDRPEDIAEDVASELVTLHALDFMEKRDGVEYGIVVTIQPTTPLIETRDIDACIGKLVAVPPADTIFTGFEMRELPTWARRIREDGFSENIWGKASKGDQGISQKQPKFYVANGGAYATRRRTLKEMEMLIGPRSIIHVMPYERSVDIDEPLDVVIAERLLELRNSGCDIRDYVLGRKF